MSDAEITGEDKRAAVHALRECWDKHESYPCKMGDRIDFNAGLIAIARREGANANRLKTAGLIEEIKTLVRMKGRQEGLKQAAALITVEQGGCPYFADKIRALMETKP